MKYEGYYIVFFIFIGLLLIIFNYNIQQQQQQQQLQQQQQQLQQQQIASNINVVTATTSIKQNRLNANDDHIRLYTEDAKYKKIENTKDTKYTYNIDNIDILKDTISNNEESKLGNPNRCEYDPELDEIYNTPLRGDDKYKNIDNEIFNYSIKPNKTDLPIVNVPAHLLLNGAPLRLSERHLL